MTVVAELVNLVLAVVFWMTLGRLALDLITGGRENFFSGVFRRATDPAFALVGLAVPRRWVPLAVLVLTLALRFTLLPLLRQA
jgi:hypothetical protein